MQVLQKKEETIRQAFVQKVKEKENELTVAEQEVQALPSKIKGSVSISSMLSECHLFYDLSCRHFHGP